MIKITSIESGSRIKLNGLFYGETGVGKTTLLGSAEDCEFTSPILIIDIDQGLASLSGSASKVVRPRNFEEIQEIYNYLRFENTRFKAVGIDSVTEMQRKLSMDEITGMLNQGDVYTNLAAHVPPDRYNWLSSGDQMRRFIRAFRDLAYLPDKSKRIHVFISALERVDEKQSIICPSLPGVLGLEIGASVDMMGRMSIEEKEVGDDRIVERYCVRLKKYRNEEGMKVLAKVRVPKGTPFPKVVYNPTIDKLVRLWMERSGQVVGKGV